MEVLREAPHISSVPATEKVSILVLMEVLREASSLRAVSVEWRSFNPCFNGSVERGGDIILGRILYSQFQSLF